MMYSDPSEKDSDGDGYMDGEDPRPNINDITVYELTNDYVSVDTSVLGWDNENTASSEKYTSYGGAQEWFYRFEPYEKPEIYQSNLLHSYYLRKVGCGLISAGDVLLYLSKSSHNYQTVFTEQVISNDGLYLHSTYDDYMRYIEKHLFNVNEILGVPGSKIASGMNVYFGIDDFEKYGEVNSYYVTVTGAQYDTIKDKYYLIVSSWGKQFIIDYDEYYVYKNNGSFANFFDDFTNILYIYKSI